MLASEIGEESICVMAELNDGMLADGPAPTSAVPDTGVKGYDQYGLEDRDDEGPLPSDSESDNTEYESEDDE